MKEALEDTWNITQVNQVLAYKADNLAKSGKVQNSVVNFISYYGCVHVGQANLTGEALYHLDQSKAKQVEKQEQPMWCEVADDSVVVINSEPVKGGNILEGKIQKILCKMS